MQWLREAEPQMIRLPVLQMRRLPVPQPPADSSQVVMAVESPAHRRARDVELEHVPAAELRTVWDKDVDLAPNARRLCPHFRVSRIVFAIKARSVGLTAEKPFHSFVASEIDRSDPKSSGGDSYLLARSRNGAPFMKAVVASAMSGNLLLRDAGGLLGIPCDGALHYPWTLSSRLMYDTAQ
ncbi:MAG: hypothetical protein HC883_03910 [Bdellovibrionaceae bacterium]|nr:hypothetical protein [Pseudobdellovibrionaceae bacterium]